MPTPQSGQRADAGLDRRLRKTEDDVRQLRERFARPQRIPEPSGAAVIGNAEAFSDTYTADAFGLVFNSWTFTTHDYWPGDGAPTLVEVSAGSDEFDPSEAGWYQGHAYVDYWVTDAGSIPPYIRIEVNPASNYNTDATVTEVRGLITAGSYSFVRTAVHTGNFYHPGPGEGNHFLGVTISHPSTSGVVISTAHVSYMIDRVR